MKDTGLKGIIKLSFADFNRTDNSDVVDTHKYLMKGTWHKLMFELIIGFLTGLVIYYAICVQSKMYGLTYSY